MEPITARQLNRATLARQMLLERVDVTPLAAIERLVGMQAQAPTSPYFGLWSRLNGFTPDALSTLIEERRAVRIATMRSTVHLHSAADALEIRAILQPALERGLNASAFGKQLRGIDATGLVEAARSLVDDVPHTGAQLAEKLGAAWPDVHPLAIQSAIRIGLALVQVPPRGLWGRSGRATLTTVESWLGAPVNRAPSPARMIRRYLAAFGPATVADVQAWSGLTRLGEIVAGMKDELITFDGGRYDLPDAPRPPADTPAPVRLIAEFDNLTLSYADRSRVLSEGDRKRAYSKNGLIPGMILVDGTVAGVWRLTRRQKWADLEITAYRSIGASERSDLMAEAARMLAFAAPDHVPEIRIAADAT